MTQAALGWVRGACSETISLWPIAISVNATTGGRDAVIATSIAHGDTDLTVRERLTASAPKPLRARIA